MKWLIGTEKHSDKLIYLDLKQGRSPSYTGINNSMTMASFKYSLENFLINYPTTYISMIGSYNNYLKMRMGENYLPPVIAEVQLIFFIKTLNYEIFLRKKNPKEYSSILVIFSTFNWESFILLSKKEPVILDYLKYIVDEGFKYNVFIIIEQYVNKTQDNIIINDQFSKYSKLFNLCNITNGIFENLDFNSEYNSNNIKFNCNFNEFVSLKMNNGTLAYISQIMNKGKILIQDVPVFNITDDSKNLIKLAEIFNELVIDRNKT